MFELDEFREFIKKYKIIIELHCDNYKIKKKRTIKKIKIEGEIPLYDNPVCATISLNEYNNLIKIYGYTDFMSSGNLQHLRIEIFSYSNKKHLYRISYEPEKGGLFRKTKYSWLFTGRNIDNPESIIVRRELILPNKILDNCIEKITRLKFLIEFVGFLEVLIYKEKINQLDLQTQLFDAYEENSVGGELLNEEI